MISTKSQTIDGQLAVGRSLSVGGEAVVQGGATVNHDLRVKGRIAARDIQGNNKGLFSSEESLNGAYPKPHPGWYAYVEGDDINNPTLYVVGNGLWTPLHPTHLPDYVDLHDYRAEIGELVSQLVENIDELDLNLSNEVSVREEAINNEVVAREAAVNAVREIVGVMTLDDMDLHSWDDTRRISYCHGMVQEPSFYKVVDSTGRSLGTMQMFSDNLSHQITQIFITNSNLGSDGTFFSGHNCTEYRTYRRNLGKVGEDIRTASWSAWTVQEFVTDWRILDYIPKGALLSYNGVLYKALVSLEAGGASPYNNPNYKRLTQNGCRMITEQEYDLAKDNNQLDEDILYLIEEEE